MDFVFVPFKKTVIVKKCYGHCRLHKILNYTIIEKNELEVELMRIKNLYWTNLYNRKLYIISIFIHLCIILCLLHINYEIYS